MPDADLDCTWLEIQDHLRRAVPDSVYQIWFDSLEPRQLAGTTLLLAAPDSHVPWLADRFARVLQAAAAAVLGPDAAIDVIAASAVPRASAPLPPDSPSRELPSADPHLHPRYTFDQFVIGEGNRLAHAAALAVAEQPSHAYNPLFLYGPPGVGKTHLLHSIAHYLSAHCHGVRVRYTTVEAFTSAFVAAIQHHSVDRFKRALRTTDVLLMDDVQFLQAKARTEEEFFHTFNALYDTGSQLVLTSDRLPRDMAALEERLLERFESGLVADIAAPDLPTRLTILRKRAEQDGLDPVDARSLQLIAERVTDNVRALEGALIRVVAYHSLRHPREPLTPALTAHVLDKLYPATRPAQRATVRDIQEVTCETFGLSVQDLVSPSRTARIAWPRQLAMYLSRELTDATLPAIGRAFGGRDHATVLYAVRRAGSRIASDPSAQQVARSLTDRLSHPGADRSE